MPYKERNKWRAQVKVGGKKIRADFSTRKEAVAWEAKTREQLMREADTQGQTQTGMGLADFSNRYLDHCKLRYTPKVYKEKLALCKRLLSRWDNIPVTEVTPEMINDYLMEQAQDRSPNAHNKDRKNLLAMWNWGLNILDLRTNPVGKVSKLPHDRKPQYTPTTEQILRVMQACTREERIFLNCYLHTGARRAEIFRWEWGEDINFDRREVRLGTRKTRDGSMEHEWLPMNEDLYQELWYWWQNRPIKDTPYVFVSTSNRHYGEPFTTRRQFMKGLCKRAGVKPFGFHALRRYVASLLADTHKISSKTIQRILRHKNLNTTERYIHNLNRDLHGTMELLREKKGPQAGPPINSKGLGNDS